MRRECRLLLVGMAALVLAACGSDNEFEAQLTGDAERPTPVATSATGEVAATLGEDELTLVVAGSFEGLTGPATAAHIHGPADEETAAGIICPLAASADATGTVIGTCTMTEEQVEQLRDGLMYVNVHTAQFPQGEIRGQLE